MLKKLLRKSFLDIPVKIIKENKDLISYFVYNSFNNAFSNSQYPNGLKYANVTPVFKTFGKSKQKQLSTYKYSP